MYVYIIFFPFNLEDTVISFSLWQFLKINMSNKDLQIVLYWDGLLQGFGLILGLPLSYSEINFLPNSWGSRKIALTSSYGEKKDVQMLRGNVPLMLGLNTDVFGHSRENLNGCQIKERLSIGRHYVLLCTRLEVQTSLTLTNTIGFYNKANNSWVWYKIVFGINST